MPDWKANADEKRAIRAVAAMGEGKKPGAISIEIGERIALDGSGLISCNLLTFGDADTALDKSDLHSPSPWSDLDYGVELIDGKAIVDFYVYEKRVGDLGELLSNVQAHVETIQGKPRLKKITGTGIKTVSGETLWAFMHPPVRRQFGTRANLLVGDWCKANSAR